MKILSFDKHREQTDELAEAKVVNVERDSDTYTTIYLEEVNGKVWYLIVDTEELRMIQNPLRV